MGQTAVPFAPADPASDLFPLASILDSLHRLAGLEGDLRVLPGHGSASTLETERKTNPFMQL